MESNLYMGVYSISCMLRAKEVRLRKTAQPHFEWTYYQVPGINHTLYSHIPTPIVLPGKKLIREESENLEQESAKIL